MPFFQDDLGETLPTKQIRPLPVLSESLSPQETGPLIKRKASEESIRTELCEGLLLDSPPKDTKRLLDSGYQFPDKGNGTSDRGELVGRMNRSDEHAGWLAGADVRFPCFFIL